MTKIEPETLEKLLKEVNKRCVCDRCGRKHYSSFMLVDEVWKIIADQGFRIVCIHCAEELVGRELDLPDFKEPPPVNVGIIWALKKRNREK